MNSDKENPNKNHDNPNKNHINLLNFQEFDFLFEVSTELELQMIPQHFKNIIMTENKEVVDQDLIKYLKLYRQDIYSSLEQEDIERINCKIY